MPSAPNLGAFDRAEGPIPFQYGKWSEKWETSTLRYEPPHRPLVRLSARKQLSVREMQSEMREKEKLVLSNPDSTYRLPGFNTHISRSECLKTDSFCSNTSFQTPQELESIKLTQKLNTLSSKPMKKILLPKSGTTKKFHFSESSNGARLLTASTVSGNTEVESYVSELRKQVDPGLSPSPSIGSLLPEHGVGLADTRASACDTPTHSLFFLEAEGTNEVWIPSGRMPSKPDRFATYPALSMKKDGLMHKIDSSQVNMFKIWPLEVDEPGTVVATKVTPSPKKIYSKSRRTKIVTSDTPPTASRHRSGTAQDRERVYPNMLPDNKSASAAEGSIGSKPMVGLDAPNMMDGSMIITPSPSLSASYRSRDQPTRTGSSLT